MRLLKKELKLTVLFILPTIIITFIFALFTEHITIISAVSNYSMLIGFILVVYNLKKEQALSNWKKIFSNLDIIVFILFVIIGFCWTIFSSQLFFNIFPYSEEELPPMTIHDIICSIIIAPIIEEFVFRYGFTTLGEKYGKLLFSSVLSVVFFTVIHFPDLPSAFTIAGAAILYTYIFFKTNNIMYSMTAHIINNSFSVISFYFPIIEKTILGAESISELNNIYFISSIILMAICLILLNIKFSRRKQA